ncbi:phospholipase [Priestia aryabhattai]|uniref:alpha/beta fold hydrolase n=1 Tax=Bacillaceae TaxID=186817 RepID=UPI000BA10B2A|nr:MULTISPECIES: alpha/beta hydrolase [Bacillaceae]MDT2045132.1 alpha/beta hydrolase [Priestia flexa]OZT12289.1 phospholipase [Priestia aryabhattai]TDB51109.1 alpha/beta hydrolase [Bacillus sp. CBEL-1]USY54786.1 lysophospholipase [Bacillus sp. 1780r2a1]
MRKWETENPKGVVVIVHGAAEHQGRYRWLVEMWRSVGMNVVMGDLPGQGLTTRRRGHILSFDEYVHEIENWVKEAQAYDLPIFLLGHSMGGLAVIRTLQLKNLPIWGAILSSPCLGLKEQVPAYLDVLSKGLNKVMPTKLFDLGLTVEKATRNPEVRDEDQNDSLYVTKVSVRWYRELVEAINMAFRDIEKMPDVPLLVMQAGEDKIIEKLIVKQWFDEVDLSEKIYKEWPQLYHEIFNEPERDYVFTYANSFVNLHI